MATKKKYATNKGAGNAEGDKAGAEFQYIPLENIMVHQQVRSSVNIENESFKSLMKSIQDRGVLEPLLVTPGRCGNDYTLLCGERRFCAAQNLGLPSVPVRIIDAVTEADQILAYQLTENLQREDLNPIDQAQGILSFFQAKHPEKNYDVDGVMSELVKYKLRPEDLPDEIRPTVGLILEVTGKSINTTYNTLSLLLNPAGIQSAIQGGAIPLSQGYLFAANLDCPDIESIFNSVVKTPVTNAALERMLTAHKKVKPDPDIKPVSLKTQLASARSMQTILNQRSRRFNETDLLKLYNELKAVCVLIEHLRQAPQV